MNTSSRQELMQALADLSAANPDTRLGQLVANLSYLARGPAQESIWDVEDAELLAAARQLLEQFSKRHAAV